MKSRVLSKSVIAAALSAGFCIAVATPASAAVETFLSFSSTKSDFAFTENAAKTGGTFTTYTLVNGTQVAGFTPVSLNFADSALNGLNSLPFALALTGNIAAPAPAIQSVLQSSGLAVDREFGGAFAFKYTGSSNYIVNSLVTLTPGETIVSGTFSEGQLFARIPGSTGSINASTATLGVVVTFDASPLFDFSSGATNDLSIALDGISNLRFSGAYDVPASFNGTIAGNFATAAPEPANWLLLLAGFAGIGAAMRCRLRPEARPAPDHKKGRQTGGLYFLAVCFIRLCASNGAFTLASLSK